MKNETPIYSCGDSSLRWLHIRMNGEKEAILSVPVDLPENEEISSIETTLSAVYLIPTSFLHIVRGEGSVFEARVKLPIGSLTIESWLEGSVKDVNESLKKCESSVSAQSFGYSAEEAVVYSNEESIRVCDVILNHTMFVPLHVVVTVFIES